MQWKHYKTISFDSFSKTFKSSLVSPLDALFYYKVGGAPVEWESSIMLFMPEGCWLKPHIKLWTAFVSRNLPQVPYEVLTNSPQALITLC